MAPLFIFAVSIAIAGGASVYAAGLPGLGQSTDGCQPNTTASLTSVCMNGWRGSFYPSWSLDTPPSVQIRAQDLVAPIEILDVSRPDHMARVRYHIHCPISAENCHNGVLDGETWVNLDHLSCTMLNTARYSNTPIGRGPGCDREDSLEDLLKRFKEPRAVSEKARHKILDLADALYLRTQGRANADFEFLMDYYDRTRLTPKRKCDVILTAYEKIDPLYRRASELFGPDCESKSLAGPGIPQVQKTRGERQCNVLRETYFRLRGYLEKSPHRCDDPAAAAEIARRFDDDRIGRLVSRKQVRHSDLSFRMLLFYGMDFEEASFKDTSAFKAISFKRKASELTQLEIAAGVRPPKTDPTSDSFYELGDGYLFGGDGTAADGYGMDCTGYVWRSLAQPRIASKDAPAVPLTSDYQSIAMYLAGEGPKPKRWLQYLPCFTLLEPRLGHQPMSGDLVVTRSTANGGHAILVDQYDAETGAVLPFEAAGGRLGTMNNLDARPLLEPSCLEPSAARDPSAPPEIRPFRAHTYILRLSEQSGCPIADTLKITNAVTVQ